VQKVEFPGYGAMWKGMVNNHVDAAIASTISGVTKELEVSPRGIVWPRTPHNDEAGWQRVWKVAPYYQKHMATEGTGGISKEKPYEGPNYPYPIVMAYDTLEAELVYNTVKAAHLYYANYKDGAPGADGWDVKRQEIKWVLPYHEGAVRYYKEIGVWKAEHEAHNTAILQRQGVLLAAWEAFKASNPADEAFAKDWPKARAAALIKAGMDPVWSE